MSDIYMLFGNGCAGLSSHSGHICCLEMGQAVRSSLVVLELENMRPLLAVCSLSKENPSHTMALKTRCDPSKAPFAIKLPEQLFEVCF